ncbi:MAG: hypothetical protein ACRDI3_08090 [Actinomycetota bacterium]
MISSQYLRTHRLVYRALLMLYPRSFRRDYRDLMTQAFCDRLKESGPRTWLLVIPDLFRSIPLQIMEVSLMSQKWMGSFTALAAVALVTALVIGAGPPILLLGAAVAFVGLLAVMAAKRSDRPTEYLYGGLAPKTWRWWTVLAALLAVTYVLAAVGQLIEDPKATNVGALGIMIGFAGLIFVGLRLRARSSIAGNWMIVFATAPALMFFWVVVPALVGLAIIIGAVTEISRATPQAPAAA